MDCEDIPTPTVKVDRFAQQKLNKQKPKFTLLMKGFAAKDQEQLKLREQHFLTIEEIQRLIIASFIPAPKLPIVPEWFKLERNLRASKVGIFILDFDASEICLSKCIMKEVVRFKPEPEWIHKLLTTNASRRVTGKIETNPELRSYLEKAKEKWSEVSRKTKKCTKLDLLLSPEQMLEEGYLFPKPLSEIKRTIRKTYKPVTNDSPMFALDCEMVQGEDNVSLLARVSIVDEDLNLVFDTLVKPDEPIKNYITRYSGITKSMLDPVDISLDDVSKILKKLIPRDAILCGQSLNFDLKALKTFHPYVIDTSVIYNLSGIRHCKTGLAILSQQFLNEEIQQSSKGHCSIQDARATMGLVNLKLNHGISFGDAVLDKRVKSSSLLPLSSFFHLYEAEVKIYHDYEHIGPTDHNFISVSTSVKNFIWKQISAVLLAEKSICIILTRDGYCYINVT